MLLLVENGFRFGRVTTELLRRASRILCSWKWLPIRKGYDSTVRVLIKRFSWKWLPIRKGYDTRIWGTHYMSPGWKWLPIRKGYDLTLDHQQQPLVENGFRFGRVTTCRSGSNLPPMCWKWLPIRKGYDICISYSISSSSFSWKWLPIRKGYDGSLYLSGSIPM